jgi:2-polyprenyl-3-methyl-5-hydroxy-6-metoxy-1,4-benzoquinol methylase
MDDLEIWLEKVYQAGGDRATLDQLYDQWAVDYDQHLWASGNPYIAIAAGMAGRHIRTFDAKILDAGCGTGNMALVLHQMGYKNIEGLDPSDGMLAIARKKNIYTKLHPLFLGSEIDLPEQGYDAIVAAGVLTHGHAPPESLVGMLKLVIPGGTIIFSLSEIACNDLGFGEEMSRLETVGAWQLLDRSRLYRSYPFSEQESHIHHWVFAYKKC